MASSSSSSPVAPPAAAVVVPAAVPACPTPNFVRASSLPNDSWEPTSSALSFAIAPSPLSSPPRMFCCVATAADTAEAALTDPAVLVPVLLPRGDSTVTDSSSSLRSSFTSMCSGKDTADSCCLALLLSLLSLPNSYESTSPDVGVEHTVLTCCRLCGRSLSDDLDTSSTVASVTGVCCGNCSWCCESVAVGTSGVFCAEPLRPAELSASVALPSGLNALLYALCCASDASVCVLIAFSLVVCSGNGRQRHSECNFVPVKRAVLPLYALGGGVWRSWPRRGLCGGGRRRAVPSSCGSLRGAACLKYGESVHTLAILRSCLTFLLAFLFACLRLK